MLCIACLIWEQLLDRRLAKKASSGTNETSQGADAIDWDKLLQDMRADGEL